MVSYTPVIIPWYSPYGQLYSIILSESPDMPQLSVILVRVPWDGIDDQLYIYQITLVCPHSQLYSCQNPLTYHPWSVIHMSEYHGMPPVIFLSKYTCMSAMVSYTAYSCQNPWYGPWLVILLSESPNMSPYGQLYCILLSESPGMPICLVIFKSESLAYPPDFTLTSALRPD